MIQFYFLSIILNLLAGLIILFEDKSFFKTGSEESVLFIVKNETFRLILGILLVIIGLFKLLSPIYNDLPIIGDLLPALTNITSGLFFLIVFIKKNNMSEETNLHPLLQTIVKFSRYIGIACIIVAILHFLFPTVLLL